MSCRAAMSGGQYRRDLHRGRRPTTTFASGGSWETLHSAVRRQVRARLGRAATPSAGPSVKGRQTGGRAGYDANKQVMGRKRHLLVDTRGFALERGGSAADVQDRDGAHLVAHALELVWADIAAPDQGVADGGYSGPLAEELRQQMGWEVEIVKRSDAQPKGTFAVQRTAGSSSAPSPGGAACALSQDTSIELHCQRGADLCGRDAGSCCDE